MKGHDQEIKEKQKNNTNQNDYKLFTLLKIVGNFIDLNKIFIENSSSILLEKNNPVNSFSAYFFYKNLKFLSKYLTVKKYLKGSIKTKTHRKSLHFLVYTTGLFNVFNQFSRWFSFLYEYLFNFFWVSNINKNNFFFYCFNFLFLTAKTPALSNLHLYLYKKQNSSKSFFFKFYAESLDTEKVTADINLLLEKINLQNYDISFPTESFENDFFAKKYKYLLTYWLFLKNTFNTKVLQEGKSNLNFFVLDYFIFFNGTKTFRKLSFLNKLSHFIFGGNLLLGFNYVLLNLDSELEAPLYKCVQIRRRFEKILIKLGFDNFFKKVNFIHQIVGNNSPSLLFFYNSLKVSLFSVDNWSSLVCETNTELNEFFKTNFYKFLDDSLLEKDENLFDFINLSALQKYKFIGQQQNLIDVSISKQNHTYWDNYFDTFFKQITYSFSFKYLIMLVLLSSNNENSLLVQTIKLSQKKNMFINNNFMSNYLNFYKYWSNTIPFFYLEDNIVKSLIKIQARENIGDFSVYLRQYLGGFIENLVGRKVFLKIRTKIDVPLSIKRWLTDIYRINWVWQKIIGAGFFFFDMISVLWYSLFTKDLHFLMTWFGRAMTKLAINKHKRFIRLFKTLLYKYSNVFLQSNNISGFRFDIRGKVGVTGNSKKRHTHFNIGRTSFSKKNLRIEYQQGLVYTDTGVLGVTMVISF